MLSNHIVIWVLAFHSYCNTIIQYSDHYIYIYISIGYNIELGRTITCFFCSVFLAKCFALSNQGPRRNPSWQERSKSRSLTRPRKCWLNPLTLSKSLFWYASTVFRNTWLAYFARACRVRSTRSYLKETMMFKSFLL